MAITTSAEYLLIVPCPDNAVQQYAPHGFHHIRGVASDGSWLTLATVDMTAKQADLIAIAKILAGDLPVKIGQLERVRDD